VEGPLKPWYHLKAAVKATGERKLTVKGREGSTFRLITLTRMLMTAVLDRDF